MSYEAKDDMTLKELILKIQSYVKSLFASWKFITLCGFLFAFILLGLKMPIKAQYQASLSFMLNENEGGSLGGLASMLGQFGLNPGTDESNLDKLLELSKTRAITQQVLFDKVAINEKKNFLANHFIESMIELGSWKKNKLFGLLSSENEELDLDDFKFTKSDINSFSIKEKKALKKVHQLIVGGDKVGGQLQSSYSDLTGIMSFGVTTSNEDLSIELVNRFFDNLSAYYIKRSVEKQEYDYKIISQKYDSITGALAQTQFQLAKFQDTHNNLFKKQDALLEKKLRVEEQKLIVLYSEAEKQKQLAELTLNNKTPYIQVIDRPLPPLRPINKSGVYYFLLGGFLGGLLSCVYVILKKMYREIMNS